MTVLPFSSTTISTAAEHDGRRRMQGTFYIRLDRIRPDPEQPRRSFDEVSLHELAESVRRLGILQPISVQYLEADNVYQIISGERRFRAATLAGLDEVPCWIKTPESNELLLGQIAENWLRSDLAPLELARSLRQLQELNDYSQTDLAKVTGKSKGEISKTLALLDRIAPEVQQAIEADPSIKITRRHLYALSKFDDESSQQESLAQITQAHLDVQQTEALVTRKLQRSKPGLRRRGAPVTVVKYVTAHALVTITFRRQSVAPEEILAALDEARSKAEGLGSHVTIHPPR